VRQSFRAYLDACLYGRNTRFKPDDPSTSLRTTLFHLAHRRPNEMATSSPAELRLHRCPNEGCEARNLTVRDIPDQQLCPRCNGPIFPSDCLRIWEAVEEFQANSEAINRAMNTIEHMMPIHYIRYLADNSLASLGTTAFFVDGPLAVFGNSAWLHGSIMRYAGEINDRLSAARLPRILMIGLQKTGAVVDHASLLSRFLPTTESFASMILTATDTSCRGGRKQETDLDMRVITVKTSSSKLNRGACLFSEFPTHFRLSIPKESTSEQRRRSRPGTSRCLKLSR
jgi:hypothetical protein